jgi:uncharacterized protein (TIGR00369 family)
MPEAKPIDPAVVEKIRSSFLAQGAMSLLDAQLTRVGWGEVELVLPFHKKITQQHGFVHAGMLGAVMDSACGYAALSTMSLEAGILTIEYKMNCLAPAQGSSFRLVGRVRKTGRTIVVAEADAYAISGDQEKLVATMSATEMVILGRTDINK